MSLIKAGVIGVAVPVAAIRIKMEKSEFYPDNLDNSDDLDDLDELIDYGPKGGEKAGESQPAKPTVNNFFNFEAQNTTL
jgi:hypothetical protein